MLIERFTLKAQDGIERGCRLAVKGGHRYVTPAHLEEYTNDLTEMARQGKLDPVLARDAEIRQAMQILSRRMKNNPIIIGEPGVGKTAIIEGLAQRIVAGEVPDNLLNHAIVALD